MDFDFLPLLRVRSRALNGGGLGPEAGRGHLPPRGGLRPSERPQVHRGLLQARSLRQGGPIRGPRGETQPPQKRGSDPQTAADHPQRTPRSVAQGRRGDHRQSVLLRAGGRRGERRQLLRGGAAVAGLLRGERRGESGLGGVRPPPTEGAEVVRQRIGPGFGQLRLAGVRIGAELRPLIALCSRLRLSAPRNGDLLNADDFDYNEQTCKLAAALPLQERNRLRFAREAVGHFRSLRWKLLKDQRHHSYRR